MIPSASPRRLRLAASGGVALALIGAWLGHTAEYARLRGAATAGASMLGSLHAYMVPVGMLLAVLAAAGAVRGVRVWLALGDRLRLMRTAVAAALRARPAHGVSRDTVGPLRIGGPLPLRLLALWLPVTALQIGLYLFQENVEAVVAGAPAPGLGAVSGVHALAPLVHALVALALCALAVLGARVLRRRAVAVARVEALLRVLLDRLGALRPQPPRSLSTVAAPLDRFGRLWSRPPPAPLSA